MFVRLDLWALFAFTHRHSVSGKNIVTPLVWVGVYMNNTFQWRLNSMM